MRAGAAAAPWVLAWGGQGWEAYIVLVRPGGALLAVSALAIPAEELDLGQEAGLTDALGPSTLMIVSAASATGERSDDSVDVLVADFGEETLRTQLRAGPDAAAFPVPVSEPALPYLPSLLEECQGWLRGSEVHSDAYFSAGEAMLPFAQPPAGAAPGAAAPARPLPPLGPRGPQWGPCRPRSRNCGR